MGPNPPVRKRRSRAKQGPAFVFVDSADNPELGSADTKTLIRQQAARSGCRRRRTEGASQENADLDNELTVRGTTGQSPLTVSDLVPALPLVPPPSYNGYETLRVRYNFDIIDLTSFTDVDLGRTAYMSLREEPSRLAGLLRKRSSSFLAYLPSYYGSSICLDDAIHCVAARAGQMLGFPTRASTPPMLYGKALKSLQTALNDRAHNLGADVYCATRLLALYELIALPDVNHWIYHNRGGIRLVNLRGPESHKSEFEMMLLKSQGPSIVMDEMYLKQTSMFENPRWQAFFQKTSQKETDTDVSLLWKFLASYSFVPGLLRDMRDLCQDRPYLSQHTLQSSHILERAKRVQQAFHDNHILYQHKPPHPPSLFTLPVTAESPDRARLRVFFIYVTMYMSRMRATLSPDDIERAACEIDAQTLAAQALLIERIGAEVDPALAWHLEQRNALAHSVIQSRNDWLSDPEEGLPWEEKRDFLAKRWLRWEGSWRDGVLDRELGEVDD